MAYHVALTDQDYAALADVSAGTGTPIEELVHQAIQAIAERYAPNGSRQQVGSYEHPTGESDTSEEEAEDEALADLLGSDKPWLSDMVIEDRGPRA
jgi:hypothetical protein